MVLTVFTAFSICGTAAGQRNNFVLVIDAGHGGEDPGATRGRYREKDINLEIALSLGSLIRQRLSGVDVLYTRTEDRAVGLAARGDFANRAGADLFLSIHTNANGSSSPNGSETYVMGMDKSADNLAVAKLENEVMRYEDNYTTTYAAFDPSSTEMSIIMGMMQYAHFESSLEFARMIQKRFAADTPLRDRGAKQGPFAVLWKPTMPRVLVEMGFISNDTDRRYLFSDRGKEAIAEALYAAFREYRERNTTPPPAGGGEAAAPPPSVVREFYVQLAAARSAIPVLDNSWAPYRGEVVERRIDGWFKYALGPYTQSEAQAKLVEVHRTKFREAFIVK
jgi:N-acetylmuramoyl-L-alanine amidase